MPHTKSLIEKLCEIAIHVGLQESEPTIANVIKGLRKAKCNQCDILANELSLLQEQEKERTATSVDQSGIREELIKFACRNNKYQTTNIRNTEVPAFLEMLRKGHERSVDDYLKSNQ